MYQRVSTEEFFKVIGPLNVTLEIRGNYPYKTLFRLKQGESWSDLRNTRDIT